MVARNPATGKQSVIYSSMNTMPYDWAVCHAGTWIYRQHRYAWVAGSRRHHHCPVHWVKDGRKVGYVPIHPKDVAGKLPLNREHGVFTISNKLAHSVEWARLDPSREVKLLNAAPKEFRNADVPVLSRAASPQLQAHHLADVVAARKASDVREAGTRLTFDHRSQSFMLDKHDAQGIAEQFGTRGVQQPDRQPSGTHRQRRCSRQLQQSRERRQQLWWRRFPRRRQLQWRRWSFPRRRQFQWGWWWRFPRRWRIRRWW